ncbi:MAG: hypothetical protein EX271_00480 [Acidimicrobiales bacterium]|nr:hypothetical protein [Hyphomonadaceae bacterium]RZV44966.1 MAG: hypothetical protein EX271_00480 [Acidimicrobiales bacterium]
MDNATLQRFVSDIIARGEILEADILPLRRAIGDDFNIDVHEADLLFTLNDLPVKPESWNAYFIQVITTFLIHQTPPAGYVSEINASWLRARIEKEGVVETETELKLLMNVLKLAKNVTPELEMFALDQVKLAVAHGSGYLGQGRTLKPGIIGEAEVDVLRAILYASGGLGGIGIRTAEAALLFDLNDRFQSEENHTSWQKLFVRGIANHLMMVAAYQVPSMEETLRREVWLEDLDSIPKATWKGALQNLGRNMTPGKFMENFKLLKSTEDQTFSHMHQGNVLAAEKITDGEANWLIERLNRDGKLDANERALLAFLAEECPDIHESLKPMIKAA